MRLTSYNTERLPIVLDHSVDLQRLTLGERWEADFPFLISNEGLPFDSYPQLSSLNVIDNEISLDRIHSLLCSTPSLLSLKMNSYRYKATHGSQWKHFIKTKLPLLKNFEFYVRLTLRPFIDDIAESRLNRFVVSFCKPFWREERRWLVTCNYLDVFKQIEIYTTPIWTDFCDRTKSVSKLNFRNFDAQDRQSVFFQNGRCLVAALGPDENLGRKGEYRWSHLD